MTVTVEVGTRTVKMIRSPIYVLVSAFTGVSITFAPLFIYWSGKGTFFPQYRWFVVPTCFAIAYLVPIFYFRLGSLLATAVRK